MLASDLHELKQYVNRLEFNSAKEFYVLCMENIRKTHSQNFQDIFALWVHEKLNRSALYGGTYVEFGATNGIHGSNTLLLEQNLWTGLLCEPNPDFYDELVLKRNKLTNKFSSKCVYSESGLSLPFYVTSEPDLSTLGQYSSVPDEHHSKRQVPNKVIDVKTITLYDLLVEKHMPKCITYISVDTEGSEYDILSKFFEQNSYYDVDCFTVEHNFNQETMAKLNSLFENVGYTKVLSEISRWDFFYIKKDLLK